MDATIYNAAMKSMLSYPSIQKRLLKSHLRNAFAKEHGVDIQSEDATRLVEDYRAINNACYEFAAETFSKNSPTVSEFHGRIYERYPQLDSDLRDNWINVAMLAQFR